MWEGRRWGGEQAAHCVSSRRTSGDVAEQLGLHAAALRVRWTRLRKRLQESGVTLDWL
jgi:hypothetical protein